MIADIFWLDLFTSEYKTPGLALSSYTSPYPGIGNGFRVLWPGWQRHQLQEADLNLSWLFSSWELGCFMPGKQLVHTQLKFSNLNRKNKKALELAVGPRVALELLAWEWLLRRDWRVRCLLLSPTHPHTTYPLYNTIWTKNVAFSLHYIAVYTHCTQQWCSVCSNLFPPTTLLYSVSLLSGWWDTEIQKIQKTMHLYIIINIIIIT